MGRNCRIFRSRQLCQSAEAAFGLLDLGHGSTDQTLRFGLVSADAIGGTMQGIERSLEMPFGIVQIRPGLLRGAQVATVTLPSMVRSGTESVSRRVIGEPLSFR